MINAKSSLVLFCRGEIPLRRVKAYKQTNLQFYYSVRAKFRPLSKHRECPKNWTHMVGVQTYKAMQMQTQLCVKNQQI